METRSNQLGDVEKASGKMWALDKMIDQPLGPESNRVTVMDDGKKAVPLRTLLVLAFQSLGIVYGDLGTSPLYVFRSTFPKGFGVDDNHKDEILGALSLIIYTISLIPLLKYMFVVLLADDNGEGGTFALYSLLCRHCNFSCVPSRHPTDERLTTYNVKPAKPNSQAEWMQRRFEKSNLLQTMLLVLVLLSTSMLIGDGILTPAISVLSAVDGVKAASSKLSQSVVVIISLLILVLLFSVQRFGTRYIGFLFAPILTVWFLTNGTVGVYNLAKYDASVFQAFSPHHGIMYLVRNKRKGWASLGGIVLCITGTEALYADLGHFSARAIQLAFSTLVFPCLLLAYVGQAAYLMSHPEHVNDTFYKSLPDPIYWPVFVLASVAASIASQAIISATFSIVMQSAALGCFPRIKVLHSSSKLRGQVYIPEANWIVMILCLAITAGFQDTETIGNAYGIAVVGVMLSTTLMMVLVMVIVWHKNVLLALLFLAIFGSVESVYYSAVLYKFRQGGWVPLAIAGTLLIVMYVWHYGTIKRYDFEMQHKVSVGWLLGAGQGLGMVRVPGVGLVYTDLAQGLPPILSHFITNLPAIHSVLIFVCIKYLPVNTVPKEERFHVKRIGPRDFAMFRCAARYGYMDIHKKDDDFEHQLIAKLVQYIKYEAAADDETFPGDWTSVSTGASTPKSVDVSILPEGWTTMSSTMSIPNPGEPRHLRRSSSSAVLTPKTAPGVDRADGQGEPEVSSAAENPQPVSDEDSNWAGRLRSGRLTRLSQENNRLVDEDAGSAAEIREESNHELEALQKNRDTGVVYILGNTQIRANKNANFVKKIAINWVYAFLRKVCRESMAIFSVPHESLLQVGMVYYV